MELRHFRYFVAVAEELHFAHAAKKIHIEQSPLSRAIKELENHLGVQLFERTTRSTRLTFAGGVLLQNIRRVLTALDQAVDSTKAAANGYQGSLRIALSEAVSQTPLITLLTRCRTEEPEVEVRLYEVSFSKQLEGLRHDLYDAGFAISADVGDGIVATPVWQDPLVVLVPARHPLLVHKHVPLREALHYPLVLCHPESHECCRARIDQVIRQVDEQPTVIEEVATHELMMTLVAAGYGIGFTSASRVASYISVDVVTRPLAEGSLFLTTYLLQPNHPASEQLGRFTHRIGEIAALS